MNKAIARLLANQPFLPQSNFNGVPNPGIRLLGSLKEPPLFRNGVQVRYQIRTCRAGFQVLFLLDRMLVPKLWQDPFELLTGHTTSQCLLKILTALWLFQLCSF